MPSPFQEAMQAFVAAEREYAAGVEKWREWSAESYRQHPDEEDAEQALARAGDALESELRRMMREERTEASLSPRYPHGGNDG
jgi:hypothetical protein